MGCGEGLGNPDPIYLFSLRVGYQTGLSQGREDGIHMINTARKPTILIVGGIAENM
jgi:hypothetical protein